METTASYDNDVIKLILYDLMLCKEICDLLLQI